MITRIKRSARKTIRAWVRTGDTDARRESCRILDLRDDGNDPRQLNYTRSRFVLVDSPLGLSRRNVFPMGDGSDPFEVAVARALDSEDRRDEIRRVLDCYYSAVQPGSFCEWMGLDPLQIPELRHTAPWVVLSPWRAATVAEATETARKWVLKQNEREGASLTVSDGFVHFGPVTDRKLEIEAGRLERLMNSVGTSGYQRHDGPDGDILATVLVDEAGRWKCVVEVGHHRAAVLAAMGYKRVPVRIDQVVHRTDVNAWPNVVSGVFSKHAALDAFDRLFAGRLAPVFQPWLHAVQKFDSRAVER